MEINIDWQYLGTVFSGCLVGNIIGSWLFSKFGGDK